jgi:hypothetical protein
MQKSKRQERHMYLRTTLCSLLVAIFVVWPLPLEMTSSISGHPGNDTWNHIWGHWWVYESIISGEIPIYTDLLSYPKGGTLYFIDTIQAILMSPIQMILGLVFAYNLLIILQIALSGFAAFLLSYRICFDEKSSYIALFVFELSPHLLGQAYNGISETVCAGWLPLTLWALINLLHNPTKKSALWLGFLGGICVLSSWYYGLFAILVSFIYMIWSYIRQKWLYNWLEIFKSISISIFIAGSFIIFPFLFFQQSLNAEDALVRRDPEFVEQSLINHNITDLLAFFNPTKQPSPDLLNLYGEELIIVIYIGWIAIFLSLYALFTLRNSRDLEPWILVLLIFFLFSLGPYLNIGGEYVLWGSKKIPLPFLVLYKIFPVFDRISHPFRFVTGVQLSIAILASCGTRQLLLQKHQNKNIVFSMIAFLCSCITLEYVYFSPAHLPVPRSESRISSIYDDMEEGAVLDLPMTLPNLERAVYVYHQTKHKNPVPWGLNDPMPMYLQQNPFTKILILLEGTRAYNRTPRYPELDIVIGLHRLYKDGFRSIVVHEDFYPEFKRTQVIQLLDALVGTPIRKDGKALYTISVLGDTDE